MYNAFSVVCDLCSYIIISSNLTSISGWTRRTHSELFSSKYVLFQFLPRISFLSGHKESSILVRHNRIGFCSRCVQYRWDPRKRSGEIFQKNSKLIITTQALDSALVGVVYDTPEGGWRRTTYFIDSVESN